MAAKSANVMARVEPDIKEQAEAILSSIEPNRRPATIASVTLL